MDISFTFGIITYADNGINPLLIESVKSIRQLNIPTYEIVIVGNKAILSSDVCFQHNDVRIVDFNECIKDKWITRKKNIITDAAKYENIVYQHDYILYDHNWYKGYQKFGDNFTICMNKITNPKASLECDTPPGGENRFRDLVLDMWFVEHKLKKIGIDCRSCLIPYEEYTPKLSKYMYISGAYWVAKKNFMNKYRLNENLVWGQGEDVDFSRKVRNITIFSFNKHSIVRLNSPHGRVFSLMTIEEINKFKSFVGIK